MTLCRLPDALLRPECRSAVAERCESSGSDEPEEENRALDNGALI